MSRRTRHELQVTYQGGKPIAAYLYLSSRSGERSAETKKFTEDLLIDIAADGSPIGVEILSPEALTLDEINGALASVGQPPVEKADVAPLAAA